MMPAQPGLVILFGSGETSASGRKVYDELFNRLAGPIRVAVLETPAGFESNSAWVAGQVADFMSERLQNYHPQVTVVPARKRNTLFSPDDPAIIAPMLRANAIFLGPGSPTYAVRQLQDSLAWHTLIARHRLGAAIVLASAATLAVSAYTLPVYEIYKVGEELHWSDSLDFFRPYGLSIVFIPHWNNTDGGANLDTSRCFMGQARFDQLLALLPLHLTVVGLDEQTALMMDLVAGCCQVRGRGGVTVLKPGMEQRFTHKQAFPISELGSFQLPEPQSGLPGDVWEKAFAAQLQLSLPAVLEPSEEVLTLLQQRQLARAQRDWASADLLRQRIIAQGWQILDTPQGSKLEPFLEN